MSVTLLERTLNIKVKTLTYDESFFYLELKHVFTQTNSGVEKYNVNHGHVTLSLSTCKTRKKILETLFSVSIMDLNCESRVLQDLRAKWFIH